METATETTTDIDLETIINWGKPKRVETKLGPRILRTGKPTEQFSAVWKADRDALKAVGISWSKDRQTDEWQVCWWQQIDRATLTAEGIALAKAMEVANQNLEASRATDADIEVPRPEGLDYLPFQKAGIAFAQGKPGVLIADEMGLGKTIQAIGIINADTKISRVLIICPATLKINWSRELKKWLVRPMTIGIAGAKVFPTTDIVIVNYDVLHKWTKSLSNYWDLMVCDEVHVIKNPKTIRAKAVIGYRPSKKEVLAGIKGKSGIPARRKVGLTGTPICNRPSELFPIINWLDPETWPNFFKFALKHCGATQNGFGWDMKGATNLDELQQTLRGSIMVRRLKKDVLTELPAKRRQIIEIAPKGATKDLINDQNATAASWEDQIAMLKVAVELAKVLDSAEGYAEAVANLKAGVTEAFTESAAKSHEIALAKVPFVIEHVREQIESGKVIVFAHHLDVIASIANAFENVAVVTGAVDYVDRQKAVDRFQSDETCRVFVGGIKAAGVGLTLTKSSHVVFAELDWVPGNMSQCEDRAHRIGQTDSVLVQHIVLEGSLDARIAETLVKKQEVIDQALDRHVGKIETASADYLDRSKIDGDSEPVVPTRIKIVTVTASEIERQAESITDDQKAAILEGLQMLDGSCDGARQIDGAGFNKFDSAIGKSLAQSGRLTNKQAVLGRKLVQKYQRQLYPALVIRAGIKPKE